MIVRLILLILATISIILLIIAIVKSKPYQPMVENLDSDDYFMKDWYTIGFSLNSMKLFHLRGKLEADLKTQAKLVFGNVYFEYYANLAWAQFLTFVILILSIGLTFCSFGDVSSVVFFLIIILLAIAAAWNICVSKMKETVAKRREECEDELPNMVAKLCLLLNAGMTLHDTWKTIAYGKEGTLYEMMRWACQQMDNGDSDRSAIYKFGVLTDSSEIKKFTGNVIAGIEKGPKELSNILLAQSSELWAHKRQTALQKGEIAAGKLIVPLGITFAGIIMIVAVGAIQSMSF